VAACGADIAAIERYVNERLSDMDPDQRQRILDGVARLCAFTAPQRPSGDLN
jgi:hypothetical protein